MLLVIDAAYAEYVSRNDYESGVELVDHAENVVMTRTFSKIYGMGGLRLGWMYGPASIVDVMNRLLAEYPPEPYVAAATFSLAQRVYAKAPQAASDAHCSRNRSNTLT